MGRPSNTVQRRAQIVEALLRVMARQGYERASVAAIAQEAGLSPGLVHYHFRSKEEILIGLVEHLGEVLRARFERFADAARTERERLFAYLDAFLRRDETSSPEAVASWVALGTEALSRPEVGATYRRVVREHLAELEGLVGAVLAAEGKDEARGRAVAAGLYAAIEGVFRIATLAPGVLPEGSAAPTVRAMAEGLLA